MRACACVSMCVCVCEYEHLDVEAASLCGVLGHRHAFVPDHLCVYVCVCAVWCVCVCACAYAAFVPTRVDV